MPFLRVIRDKRGYETTYLMHWYREGSRQRSKILYVFRTPGGIRVGRDPLEPEVQRRLEADYPDIEFDWTVVQDNRQVIEAAPEPRRRRTSRDHESATPAKVVEVAAPAPVERPPAEPPPAPVPPIPAALEGVTPDERRAFLARWYPIVCERIAKRQMEDSQREALLALAEKLNPDAWTDADDIARGLESAAEALERLTRVFTRRRRRSRRRRPDSASERAPTDLPEPSDHDLADDSDTPEP